MPFQPVIPRSFSSRSIQVHAPAASGVYGLSNGRQWLYIGETDNIQEALLKHLVEDGTDLKRMQPTGFCCEVSERSVRANRQDRLVMEYEPVCNRSASEANSVQRG
jgi:hypothetical protein